MTALQNLIYRIIGDPNDRRVKQYAKRVERIRDKERLLSETLMSIDDIPAQSRALMARFAPLAEDTTLTPEARRAAQERILDEILEEAFATHVVACRLLFGQEFTFDDGHRMVWNMVPYDVQLVGAMALHEGRIAEMKTGEGKTLVATIAAYLNALCGESVHIVTVNDYLARRDAREMGILYRALGLSVGIVTHGHNHIEKQEQYKASVVYATNNELGFDYLRDNMATAAERKVQRPLGFALIDEVDSILVDEARTPLIISAPAGESTSKYSKFALLAKTLREETHYTIDEKQKTAVLNEGGILAVEQALGVDNIYLSEHYNDLHHIENALRANTVYQRDIDYLVRNDQILIIDEHTGRVLPGRRYSDGLHQALEAKEGVTIQQESRTLASITFQNFFRLYPKLSGMTGTAKTEEEEFFKIYHLEVVVIPTNRPMVRHDKGDLLFKNEVGKFRYLVKLIAECHKHGQPVLVGTVSVAKSEYLSGLLTEAGVPHRVLNAKQDEHEADIIAQAGRLGAITIATNMAGRGTDIKVDEAVRTLSGEIKVGEVTYPLGGLYVLGTEKHETRRIDNQLRGRSGRQGDPGLSQFCVSPQDDIMRIFGGDKLFGIFNSGVFAAISEDEPLVESRMLSRRIDAVQRQVEGRNFDIRKHILEYDDVLNNHRLVIYRRRDRILAQEDIHADILALASEEAHRMVESAFGDMSPIQWDLEAFAQELSIFLGQENAITADMIGAVSPQQVETVVTFVQEKIVVAIEQTRTRFGDDGRFFGFERNVMLGAIDALWMEHMDRMAHLKDEVAFEGFAQKNPLVVYKERAYERFVTLLGDIRFRVIKGLLSATPESTVEAREPDMDQMETIFADLGAMIDQAAQLGENEHMTLPANTETPSGVRVYRIGDEKGQVSAASAASDIPKVGRNDLCPCGSGKKYKHCHGATETE